MVRPRTPAARYFTAKSPSSKEPISIKTKKSKDPAPGSYNVEECYRKTQWGKSIFTIGKCKDNNYVGKLLRFLSIYRDRGEKEEIRARHRYL